MATKPLRMQEVGDRAIISAELTHLPFGQPVAHPIFTALWRRKKQAIFGCMENYWDLIKYPNKKIRLHIPEMLEWLENLPETLAKITAYERDYPFNLIVGERRSYNVNTVIRNPLWRKMDAEGALKIHPADAEKLEVANGDTVKLSSRSGSIKILTKVTDEVSLGVLSMPHGHGLKYKGKRDYKKMGAMANLLTSSEHCDPLAKTPYHKNVRVRTEKVV